MNRTEQEEYNSLRLGLEKARRLITSQAGKIRELEAMNDGDGPPPALYCTVLAVVDNSMLIANNGAVMEIHNPGVRIKVGDTIAVAPNFMFMRVVSTSPIFGSVGTIRRVVDETSAEVAIDGNVQVVLLGSTKVENGDRVVMDPNGILALKNLGKIETRHSLTQATTVVWEDIHGQESAVNAMIEAVEWPAKYGEIYARYGKKPVSGVLLYGPPGCGKTMLGQAAATSIAKRHGADIAKSGFLSVKGPEILDRWVGSAEEAVRGLFASATAHKKQHGFPAVIFIDEADALLSSRGSGISSDMQNTIVPAFLSEMNGVTESGALVILATNRPDVLDSAVTRDKRMDRKIHVVRPGKTDSEKLFSHYLRGVPLDGLSIEEAAKLSAAEMFKDSYVVAQFEDVKLTLGSLSSGAMVSGVVDRATSAALTREIKGEKKTKGVRRQDLVGAISATCRENQGLDHRSEMLPLFVERRNAQMLGHLTKDQLAS